MNAILFYKIKNLEPYAEVKLKSKISNSPYLLDLFQIFKSLNKSHFNNYEIVEKLYAKEFVSTPFAKLENRYFKLRKKLLDELDKIEKAESVILADFEDLVYTYRSKESKLNSQEYQELKQLEQKLLKLNIFEILSKVYEIIIAYNQKFNRLEENTEYWTKYDESIRLNFDILQMLMLSKKAYEANFKLGLEGLKTVLASMLKIANKNKEFSRFQLIYHFVSLYYKLSTENYEGKQKAVARHFNKVNLILNDNPEMPILWIKPDYLKKQHHYLDEISAFYHFSRLEYNEAYQKFFSIWNLSHKSNKGKAVSETVYYNMVQACLTTRRYLQAMSLADEMIINFKEPHKIAMAYLTKLEVYVTAYPLAKINDLDFLLEKSEKYLEKSIENKDLNQVFRACIVISKAAFLKNDAAKAIKKLDLLMDLDFNRTQIVKYLYTLYNANSDEDKKNFYEDLNENLSKTEGPELYNNIDWVLEILHYKMFGKRKYYAVVD